MKRSLFPFLGLSLVLLLVVGFNRYTHTEQVSISSNVAGAEIFVDGEFVGTTPFSGEIKSLSREIMIRKKDFKDFTLQLNPTYSDMFNTENVTNKLVEMTQNVSNSPIYAISSNSFLVDLDHVEFNNDSFKQTVKLRKYAISHFTDIAFDVATNNATGTHVQNMLRLANRPSNASTIAIVQDYLKEANGNKAEFAKLATRLMFNANGEGC